MGQGPSPGYFFLPFATRGTGLIQDDESCARPKGGDELINIHNDVRNRVH